MQSYGSNENSRIEIPTLEILSCMFAGKIDGDVIQMIWHESHENGAAALEMLTVMSPPLTPETTPSSTTSWSSLLTNSTKSFTEIPVNSKKTTELKESKSIATGIKERVQQHEKIIVLMRGVPGCGKTHLANQIKGNGAVLSTDDFFFNHRGQYAFNPMLLSEAHDWNRKRAERELKGRVNPIVIDNTNLEAWEMQPYISMAFRYKYTVELVEPDTPWRENAKILAKKNSHGVPLSKIHKMLEKLKTPIQFETLVDDCRRKMFGHREVAVNTKNKPTADALVSRVDPQPRAESSQNNVNDNEDRNSIKWEISPWEQDLTLGAAKVTPETSEIFISTRDVAVQASLLDTSLTTLTAKNRSINSGVTPKLEKKRHGKFTLDKGCCTEEIVEDLATRKALSILKSYFPSMEVKDLADFLEKCNCDLSWTVNLLLDSGYECADDVDLDFQLDDDYIEWETESRSESKSEELTSEASSPFIKDDETNSCTSSELSSNPPSSTYSEETEALRKHVEDCFHLTDTISDQTRRICGKDYNQFRASQLQKLRLAPSTPEIPDLVYQSLENNFIDTTVDDGAFGMPMSQGAVNPAPILEEDGRASDDIEAMIPMNLDPTFVQQLISLFGAPNLKKNGTNVNHTANPVSFNIPWSLAEQIYLHWCSNIISEDDSAPNNGDEDADLRDIMDIELAMQLVQDEKNAERKQLRESLATKLSFQMLSETYPLVDPLALDALFEANNYNYAHTVTALNASLGTKPKPAELPVTTTNTLQKDQAPSVSLVNESKTESCDLRSEANMYNRLRQEYLAKAQENHRRGMYAVATYYASESRRYAKLSTEAHKEAALQIVGEKNIRRDERTIDLHELRVIEALSYLESFITENIQDGHTVIRVITGKGNHSFNGRPRIKPAVITFIKKKKYGFEEINGGMLRVFLRRTGRAF